MVERFDLSFRFNFGDNSLYELGYYLTDLYQLIVFSELIQMEEDKLIEDNFFFSRNRFGLTRDNFLLRALRDRATIKRINKGSIELVISGVSCAAAIIVPYFIYLLQRRDNNNSQEVFFEVSTDDSRLNQLLDEFQAGFYGKGPEGLQWLFSALKERGYSVTVSGSNAFQIHKVVERYERRTIKLIKRN